MHLKIIDLKANWKFFVAIICGLDFDRTSRISCENMMKNVMISDTWVYYRMWTTNKNTKLLKG